MQEIYSSEDVRQVYNALIEGDDPYSFPVRGMLSFIMSGKIKSGQIYVDQWPLFSSVACLQMSKEYSNKVDADVDVITIYSKDSNHFKEFFSFLHTYRNWNNRGLLLMYLRHDFVGVAKNLTPQMGVNDLGSLVLFELPSRNETEQVYQQYVVDEMKKFPELKLGSAVQEDVQTIIDLYPSPIPAKEEMFRWMVSNLPSSTLRDSQGRLISWCLTYPCGVGAVLYVKPEYRRGYFGMLVGTNLCNQWWNLYPGKKYGAVSPDNTASINLNLKLNSKKTTALVNWVVFNPRTNAKL